MNLRVKTGFRDKEARRERFKGQEFKASAERAAQLVKLGVVEEVGGDAPKAKKQPKKD